MNKQAIIPLAVGLVVGILALKLGYDYVGKLKKHDGANMGPSQKVVVASRAIPLGTKLSDKDLTIVEMPKTLIPKNTLSDKKKIIGEALRISVEAKMPILKGMIGPGEGLEGVIPVGYRAVALKVDEFAGVAGLLRPGVRVDVVATFSVRQKRGRIVHISKIVLQNIEVRAVGQQFRPEESDSPKTKLSRSVTLLVKTDQVETLQLAASTGKIRLALRSATDQKSSETKGINLTSLLKNSSTLSSQNNKLGKMVTGLFGFVFNRKGNTHKTALTEPIRPKPRPFMVEVMTGERLERIYFASSDSDRRVNPGHEDQTPVTPIQLAEPNKPDLAFQE